VSADRSATITRSDDEDGPPTLSVTFEPPITFDHHVIGQFVLREPVARELREAEKERSMVGVSPWAAETAYQMRLIVLVAGLKPKMGEHLPIMVINHCMAFLDEFIEKEPDEDEFLAESEDPVAQTLPIEPPIKFAGVEYYELDVREPLGSEIRNARLLMGSAGSLFDNRRALMHLITTVSGLPAPVIEQLRVTTLQKAGRILGDFTKAGRATGKP
jgi:hypothetical protein